MIILQKIKALYFKALLFFLWLGPFLSFANKGGEASAKPTALEQFFPFIILGLVFYFLLIRPQQKRHGQHRDFLSKIKRGDEILTSSGIYGRIEGITDSFVILEVADNVRIRVAKSQVASYTEKLVEQKTEKGRTKGLKKHKATYQKGGTKGLKQHKATYQKGGTKGLKQHKANYQKGGTKGLKQHKASY